jgi:REP element-mobilizing transposase RayT
MVFVTKKRYKCFRKQSHVDTCIEAFKSLEHLGFEFGECGFGSDHVHFQVNVPKRYSIAETEIILKSSTSRQMFTQHPGFRKRYPRGAFWSGYEHYQSTGMRNLEESTNYLRIQQAHHQFKIIDDRQKMLDAYPPSGDAA